MRAKLLFVYSALMLLGCGKPLSEGECEQLLDRYTDKVIDQARPSMGRAERSEKILEARKKAQVDPAYGACSSHVTRTKFDCAMQAQNADEMERCLM